MVNTKKMRGLVHELMEKYPEEKGILDELLSAYENPYYHYCTASAISCIEDIPSHSRDFSHGLGGYPIKEPFFLYKKANEIPYLLR